MSEITSKPAHETTVGAETRLEPWRSSLPDEGTCPLHRRPVPWRPRRPSLPNWPSEPCPVCAEIERMLAEGRLPF